MNRFFRSSLITLALCVFSLVGCESKFAWLQVTGLDDGSTEGIWLWRLSEQSGTYERTCRIAFDQPQSVGGIEWLEYAQNCGDGSTTLKLRTSLTRSPASPETATVGLWYLSSKAPGAYKVSSYGIYGETALSGSTLQL